MTSFQIEGGFIAIAVVDTGIAPERSVFGGQEIQGVGVRRTVNGYQYDADFRDLSGHGTAMAARIQSFCKTAQIRAVRIAQQEENGSAVRVQEQAFAMGIDWCVDHDIKIVNVSYSIAEAPGGDFLDRACRKANEKGVIIVAAYRNGVKNPAYPAAFPTVIGVRRRNGLEPGQVNVLSEKNYDLYAWGSSNSEATAQVSAMIGRIHTVDKSLGLEAVFACLKEVAVE